MELPFLVVHGALVWKLAVVILTAVPLVIIRGLRVLAARGQARLLADDALAQVEHLSQGTRDATLRGTLRDGALLSMVQADATRDSITGAPYLELPDGPGWHSRPLPLLSPAPRTALGSAVSARATRFCYPGLSRAPAGPPTTDPMRRYGALPART